MYRTSESCLLKDTSIRREQCQWIFQNIKLSIQLYKIYNGNDMDNEWLDMNTQQNFNSRLKLFQINDFSKTRVGRNIIANRMTVLNNQINLDWLNLSLISFKLKVKNLFLMN